MNFPLEHLSASSITKFIQCPEQWRNKYLQRQPEQMFAPLFIGKVHHDVAAEMFNRKMNGEILTEGEAKSLYRMKWDDIIDDDGEVNWKDDDPKEMFRRGMNMTLMFKEHVVDTSNPIAIEQRVDISLGNDLPPIVGYVDMVERNRIREFKTTAVKVTTPKPAWRFQARIYQTALGLPVEWTVITRQVEPRLYLPEDNPDLRMNFVDVRNTMRIVMNAVERMTMLYEKYGPDEPWPTDGMFGQSCGFCAKGPKFRNDCPGWL